MKDTTFLIGLTLVLVLYAVFTQPVHHVKPANQKVSKPSKAVTTSNISQKGLDGRHRICVNHTVKPRNRICMSNQEMAYNGR